VNFREYIARRRVTDTMAGDFTRDAKGDDTLPDAQSWDELEQYLWRCSACDEAIVAARRVWRQYRRHSDAKG
jgi:hypothetical protein